MIYTITLSPAIDYKIEVDKFEFGRTLRTISSCLEAGGKGINVSIVLDQLGLKNTALLTIGGATKDIFLNLLGSSIKSKRVFLTNNNVRINLKGRDKKNILEINERTKVFSEKVIKEIKSYLESNLNDGDYVVFSGSPPTGIHESIFKNLVEEVVKDIKIIVDSRREYIEPMFDRGVFLLKPNIQELEDFAGKRITNEKEIEEVALKLLNRGVKNVLVSMDKDGSILYSKGFTQRKYPIKNIPVIETTGAGDSMVAGFIAAHSKDLDLNSCHKWSIASAIATITSPSLATKESFETWLKKV